MSDDLKFRRSIPKDDKALEKLKTWSIPQVENELTKAEQEKTNALGKSRTWVYEAPEPEPEEIKPPTLEEIEAIRKAAYEEGFAEGKAEGFEAGQAEGKEVGHKEGFEAGQVEGHEAGLASGTSLMEEKAQTWNMLIEQLDNPLEKMDQIVEMELVQLCQALAKSVIKTELVTNQDVILQSLKSAAELLPFNHQACQILVNPEDYQVISEHYTEEDLTKRNWRIHADPTIARGGIDIKTELSSISFLMDERIQEIFDEFNNQSN
ncbi:flagellar assembly protein FliH [Catenovulum maritimum]|uniref:Flagellar assembly protein FliH n=1 Tax=Catenovulum maritimum TaxID=1513271 RepID=A0A0J8GQ79_9ALTE|nr:flagellar assembly protein FliH [Catenovulum maritimum]KMT64902.1 hypothetical protein XM47_11875 [Catenovulum maritimum]